MVPRLQIQSILGEEEKIEYGLDKPEMICTVVMDAGSTITYNFSKPEGQSHYVLKCSDRELLF